MTTAINNKDNAPNAFILIPLVSSIFITFFLFFIDEGYYNFNWMLEWGAWIVFSVYVFIFFSIQFLILGFFLKLLPQLFRAELKLPVISGISFIAVIIILALAFYLFSN